MISISMTKDFDPSRQVKFLELDFRPSLEKFSRVICENVWSPIIWQNGRRAKKNFVSCSYLVLDFDNGEWSLSDAVAWCQKRKYAAILGTSKSHQKEKKTSKGLIQHACDRFRLVIPFSSTITDRELYEYQMRLACDETPCDPSCKDGARFFYPCTTITYAEPGGSAPVVEMAGICTPEAVVRAKKESGFYEKVKQYGMVPTRLAWGLRHSLPGGNRRKAIYAFSAEASRCGVDLARWERLVLQSNLVAELKDEFQITEDEVRRQILNGYDAE